MGSGGGDRSGGMYVWVDVPDSPGKSNLRRIMERAQGSVQGLKVQGGCGRGGQESFCYFVGGSVTAAGGTRRARERLVDRAKEREEWERWDRGEVMLMWTGGRRGWGGCGGDRVGRKRQQSV